MSLCPDWGEWSLNNESELDTVMQEEYRRGDEEEGEEDEGGTKEDTQTFGVCSLHEPAVYCTCLDDHGIVFCIIFRLFISLDLLEINLKSF